MNEFTTLANPDDQDAYFVVAKEGMSRWSKILENGWYAAGQK